MVAPPMTFGAGCWALAFLIHQTVRGFSRSRYGRSPYEPMTISLDTGDTSSGGTSGAYERAFLPRDPETRA